MNTAAIELNQTLGAPGTGTSQNLLPNARIGLEPVSAFPRMSEIPEKFQIKAPLEQREYLVNGEIKTWDGPLQKVFSPIHVRTEAGVHAVDLGSYPLMDKDSALECLDAAVKANAGGRGSWAQASAEDHIAAVEKLTEGMLKLRDTFVKGLMWEIGKTLPDSEKEFDRTIEYIRDSIKALRAMDAKAREAALESGILARVDRAPIGVVLCMGPFNYPLNETFTTLIPALLMGNTVVFKAPKIGVLLYEPLLKVLQESMPPGVINVVYGDGKEVINPIMASGKVDVFAFIGSDRVADLLIKAHPHPHRLTSILGLGAQNVAIVLKDADIEKATDEILAGALGYNGQRCTAIKRIFVADEIADKFSARLAEKVESLPLGMPWEKGVKGTPLPEPGKVEWMDGMLQDAIALGARVLNQKGGHSEKTLYTPAVLYPVSLDARLMKEEQFGPLVPISRMKGVGEVLEYLAKSDYGQQASIFGQDPAELGLYGHQLSRLVTRVNFNTQCQRGPDNLPFTGRKSSALGTLSIEQALEAMSIECVFAGKNGDITRDALRMSE